MVYQSVAMGGISPDRLTVAVEQRKVWMVDVDGVLLNLVTKQAEEGIIRILAQYLQKGEPVTFYGDRASLTIAELIVSRLERHLPTRSLLSRVLVVGEKGGVWGTYTPDGAAFHITRDPMLTVPLWLKTAVGTLVAGPEFEPFMTVEAGTYTMVTVVKRPGVPLACFHRIQAPVASLMEQTLHAYGLSASWKIDVVSDAIEIAPSSANKGKVTRRMIQWLSAQGICPSKVVVIEDRPSCLALSQMLDQLRIPTDFIFTGVRDLPPGAYPFPIIRTRKSYEQETMDSFRDGADGV